MYIYIITYTYTCICIYIYANKYNIYIHLVKVIKHINWIQLGSSSQWFTKASITHLTTTLRTRWPSAYIPPSRRPRPFSRSSAMCPYEPPSYTHHLDKSPRSHGDLVLSIDFLHIFPFQMVNVRHILSPHHHPIAQRRAPADPPGRRLWETSKQL